MSDILWSIIAFCRFFCFLIISAIFIPLHVVYGLVTKDWLSPGCVLAGITCKILGIKVIKKGEQVTRGPIIYVANHMPWADVVVLGALFRARFVSKEEVKSWPLFGLLATLRRTIYIQRTRKGVIEGNTQVKKAIEDGDNVAVFPEGTNSYVYDEILPFKSNFLSIVEEAPTVRVQPVAAKVTAVNGQREIDQALFERYAWADMEFLPHFWRFLKTSSFEVTFCFCPPLENSGDRKDMTKKAEDAINKAWREI